MSSVFGALFDVEREKVFPSNIFILCVIGILNCRFNFDKIFLSCCSGKRVALHPDLRVGAFSYRQIHSLSMLNLCSLC